MKTVDFYFDFMSPFAYLAAHRLPELSRRYEKTATFRCHPIDLIGSRPIATRSKETLGQKRRTTEQ